MSPDESILDIAKRMMYGPKVKARLIKTVTEDGIADLKESCQVGDEYWIFPRTKCVMKWGRKDMPGVQIERETVVVEGITRKIEPNTGVMPLELFEVITDA